MGVFKNNLLFLGIVDRLFVLERFPACFEIYSVPQILLLYYNFVGQVDMSVGVAKTARLRRSVITGKDLLQVQGA